MNEPLRRALLRARLREDDVAARLGVDPKTVRRWLSGRVPYPHNRTAIVELVGADEAELWPDAGGLPTARSRPEELGTVYPHWWAVPREVWVRLFGSAEREIAILAYSALFLAEDARVLQILADKGRAGVTVRIALGDPDWPNAAERGEGEGIGGAMPAKIRNALTLYRPLDAVQNIEIRLHRRVLYNSIYCADGQLLINQYTYGIPAAQAPVFRLSSTDNGEMTALYLDSFKRVWSSAKPLAWHHRLQDDDGIAKAHAADQRGRCPRRRAGRRRPPCIRRIRFWTMRANDRGANDRGRNREKRSGRPFCSPPGQYRPSSGHLLSAHP